MPTAEPLGRASSAHRVVLWVVMTIVAFAALGYMIAH